jgi:hypothetical protein
MKRRFPLIAALLVPLALACCANEEAPNGTAAASASARASASPAASGPASKPSAAPSAAPEPPKCEGGEHAQASPAFCIKLPEGFSAEAPEKGDKDTTIRFEGKEASASLKVACRPDPAFYEFILEPMEADTKGEGDQLVGKGDTPGGKGKYFTVKTKNTMEMTSAVKMPNGTCTCESQYALSAPVPALEEACKSLHP